MRGSAPRLLAACGLQLLLGAANAPAEEAGSSLSVRNVRAESIGRGQRVTITLTRPPEGMRGSPVDNLQLTIELEGPNEAGPEVRYPLTDTLVTAVRATPHAGGLRLVLDLSRDPGPVTLSANGVDIVVDLAEITTTKPIGVGLVGKRMKFTGRWVGQHLEVTRVIARDSRKDPRRGRVNGDIDSVGPEPYTFRIGGVVVQWTDATRFLGVNQDRLARGVAVEATGRLGGPAYLIADIIEPSKSGRGEILGAITAQESRADGSTVLTVLGAEVIVPVGVSTKGAELTRRLDEKRPDSQLTFQVYDRPLTIGGEVEVETDYKRNIDLEGESGVDMENHIQLEGTYFFSPRMLAFVQGEAIYAPEWDLQDGTREDTKALERREHWLFVGDILSSKLGSGYSVQIGRQKFQEVREWWWDENLDALRFSFDRPEVHFELGAAEDFFPDSTESRYVDPIDDGVFRLLGDAAWAVGEKQRLDFFYLYQLDHSDKQSLGQIVRTDREDPTDANLLWLGTRAIGAVDADPLGDLTYGVDAAWVNGHETVYGLDDCADSDTDPPCPRHKHNPAWERVSSRNRYGVGGFAFDARGTLETPVPTRPAITLGYAFGSGDANAKNGVDTGFRQTGLQANKDRFLGVDRFRYYGPLLRPELSNLHIVTAALGYRFLDSSSIELLYHFYRQATPAPFLRDARIKADVNDGAPGTWSSVIGHEWDMVLGLEEWEHLEVELIGSLFLAGPAYGSLTGNLAEGVFLKLKYNF